MRIMPLLTAIVVSLVLYGLVFEREAMLAFAQVEASGETEEMTAEEIAPVSVVAMASVAQTVDNAIILRGRTEAARQVAVASETSGQVISDPA